MVMTMARIRRPRTARPGLQSLMSLERGDDVLRDVRSAVDAAGLIDDEQKPALLRDGADDVLRLLDNGTEDLLLLLIENRVRLFEQLTPLIIRLGLGQRGLQPLLLAFAEGDELILSRFDARCLIERPLVDVTDARRRRRVHRRNGRARA